VPFDWKGSTTPYTRNVVRKQCALNEATSKDGVFNAVIKMVEGPPLALFRRSQQTAPRC